jgi:hypothetical protein
MALKFTDLLDTIKAVASSRLGAISNQGMNWMLEKVGELRRAALEATSDTRYTPSPEKIIDELSTAVKDDDLLKGVKQDHPLKKASMFKIGDLILFQYDAKLKDKLPYWDRFPVVFPINFYKDGFLGINLHYLPPLYRAQLMDALYNIRNNQNMDETTVLNVSYEILKGASQFKSFKPCVKRYLYHHITSHWLIIAPEAWEPVLFLPIARFQKANQQRVWDDSLKRIQ